MAQPQQIAAARSRGPAAVMLALTAASGSFALMQAVIVPVLGDVQSDLDTTAGWTAWTVSIYLLAASVATPLLGRLGDQFGKDRLLLVTLVIFTIGNLAAIFAWNIWSLIAFRALQGVAGAAYPLSFSIIRDQVSPARSGIAMGLISAMLGVGGGIGIVMSGVVGDHASWRWLFVIGTGLGLLALALAATCLPRSARQGAARLDIRGALLLSAGLICLLVALTEGNSWGWSSGRLIGMVAGGLAILVLWGAVERRTAAPLVDMRMLSRRPVLLTNLAALFCGFMMYAVFTVLPLFSQLPRGLPPEAAALVDFGFGASITVSALYLLPGAAAMLPAGPLGGVLGRRIGYQWALCLGLLVAGLGTASLAAFHSEPWQLMVAYSFGAAGVAVAFGAMPKLITDAVDRSETGIATGMNTVVRTVGSVIGAQAAITLISNDTIAGTAIPAESGFAASLWLGAAAALTGAVIAVGIAPRRRRTAEQPAPVAG